MSGICSGGRFLALFAIILAVVFMFYIFNPKNNRIIHNGIVGDRERLTNLTFSQETAFTQFKERVKSKFDNERQFKFDVFLIKWLQVANFDVEKAEQLLTENVAWKKEQETYTILDEDWSDMEADFEYSNNQVDFLGRPVLIINMGKWNIKKAVKNGRKDRLNRFMIKMYTEITNLVYEKYEAEGQVTQLSVIVDMDEFRFFQGICVQCMGVYIQFADVHEYKWPKMGAETVMINTPGVFSVVINLIKSMLREETRKTMRIFGDREEGKKYLNNIGIQI